MSDSADLAPEDSGEFDAAPPRRRPWLLLLGAPIGLFALGLLTTEGLCLATGRNSPTAMIVRGWAETAEVLSQPAQPGDVPVPIDPQFTQKHVEAARVKGRREMAQIAEVLIADHINERFEVCRTDLEQSAQIARDCLKTGQWLNAMMAATTTSAAGAMIITALNSPYQRRNLEMRQYVLEVRIEMDSIWIDSANQLELDSTIWRQRREQEMADLREVRSLLAQ